MTQRKVVCLLAFTLFLRAQDPARSGGRSFRVPPGWARTDSPPGTILNPVAEPKESVALLLGGRALNGDFRAVFDQMVKSMNGNLRPAAPGQVQSRHLSEGIDLLAVTVELQAPNGLRPANPPAVPAETSPSPAAAALSANRLDGVYSGFKFINVTILGVVQRKAVNDYFSFFPDGTVYWGLPQTGLAGFDMARACQGALEFCGTYQMNGDRLAIALNRGTYHQAGSRTSGGLQIEDR